MTTANPKPDARALVAGVLKGLESADHAFLEVAKSSLKGTAGLKIPTAEASKAFVAYVDYVATVESELGDLRTREKALAKFVREIANIAVADEKLNHYAVIHDNVIREARLLLVKLAEGKP